MASTGQSHAHTNDGYRGRNDRWLALRYVMTKQLVTLCQREYHLPIEMTIISPLRYVVACLHLSHTVAKSRGACREL
jgi:hypothetical protein